MTEWESVNRLLWHEFFCCCCCCSVKASTYVGRTLHHRGQSLRLRGSGWSASTHLASHLWRRVGGWVARSDTGAAQAHISPSAMKTQRSWFTNTIKYLEEKKKEKLWSWIIRVGQLNALGRSTRLQSQTWATKYIQVWRRAGRLAPAGVLHVDRQTDVGRHAWWWQDSTGVDVWTGQKMDGWMDGGDGMKRHRRGEGWTDVGRAARPAGLKRNRVQVEKWRDVSGATLMSCWPQSARGLKGQRSQNWFFIFFFFLPNPHNPSGVSQREQTTCKVRDHQHERRKRLKCGFSCELSL